MKIKFVITILALIVWINIHAQGVGINDSNTNPDPSAILDIESDDKGVLVPRMTAVQRNAISVPAKGLLVYDTDSSKFFVYDLNWKPIGNGKNGSTVLNGIIAPTTEGVDGDFYINTSTYQIYGPKTLGNWGASTAMTNTSTPTSTKCNCSVYIIPYMPYGTGTSQIIYMSRGNPNWFGGSGTNPADQVTVEAVDDAGTYYNLGVIKSLPAGGLGEVTKLSSEINTALIANGFADGKVMLKISVNNPEYVYVYSSYNVGGSDRGYVEVECVK